MPKKNEAPASFETALGELEQIVNRLESGDLPLEEALSEFERDVQLRTSEHRSMYSYVRLSIDRCTLRTSEHRSMYSLRTSEHRSMYSTYV